MSFVAFEANAHHSHSSKMPLVVLFNLMINDLDLTDTKAGIKQTPPPSIFSMDTLASANHETNFFRKNLIFIKLSPPFPILPLQSC